jgi:3'(2'), 5'-bisphosphate nucleotidase
VHENAARVQTAWMAVLDACVAIRFAARERPDALTKGDLSPVTVADFAAQAVIVRRLRAELGAPVVIGEERADLLREPERAREREAVVAAVRTVWAGADEQEILATIDAGSGPAEPSAGYWALDPIDGTKGFLRGQHFAVCLAWVQDGQPRVGVVGCPRTPAGAEGPIDALDEIGSIVGTDGRDAWLAAATTDAARRRLADLPQPPAQPRVVRSVEADHGRADQVDAVLQRLGAAPPIGVDGQVKYALVSRGRADLYLRMPRSLQRRDPVWDHAAGVAVATAVGARVTDLHGRALDFSRGPTLADNFGIVCAHPDLHARALEAVAAARA